MPASPFMFSAAMLKKRLGPSGQRITGRLNAIETELASSIFSYTDILFGARSIHNARALRDLSSLHALNHIFKTRDRVIKNNAKLAQHPDGLRKT
ncbi:utp25_pyrtr ame: full=u3 small nucleolar rna-associated protein 25 short=u3 snorna-associated protein 25 ame: full=u three protein 25 [Lasallia pustulata]|uniref:U three protein 25 n=1 Tax=Lasallia pustulata TaxID=136370 RepID=A0A1W5D4V2_9LECA|nr:utp25_pyrtr ame: full=u3 small nucleolar rna-associated protein 25 short=u3 snorna-associated protein 25 ame: full=u three protein 25 [Lasallia pustulata]